MPRCLSLTMWSCVSLFLTSPLANAQGPSAAARSVLTKAGSQRASS
ncbi:MAG: hypothetical protein NTY19_18790 [Planctomycetota bacterium]|nr:hypothetical protein [Planctomycetota bacterium]